MWSACGTRSSGAFASSAARWRTPKRCCSSTTTTARSRNSTGSSISACVPTTSWSCPLASRSSSSRRRAALVEPVRSSTGSGPPSSESSVRWCCSASVSVGAIRAAWAPFSTARSMAARATHGLSAAHLPHQQPLHRLLAREVRVDLLDRALLVARELERERPAPAVHHHPARLERPRAPALAPRAAAPRHSELEQEQLLEGEPAAGVALVLLAVREVRRLDRGRPLGQLLLDAQPSGQRLDHREHARARLAHELAQARWADALRGGVHGHEPERVHRRLAVADQLVLGDPELVALAELAVEQHHRPLAELARHPRLVEPDGHERAGLVEDARLHALLAPVAHRLDRRGPNRDRNGRLLADHQLGDAPHLATVAVRVRAGARRGRPRI